MLIQLIYTSSAVRPLSQTELLELLDQSRETNKRLEITGRLLYHSRSFMQVLEGEKDAVVALYREIEQNSRYYQVILVSQQPVAERQFADWHMAFVDLGEIDLNGYPGYSDFLNTPLNVGQTADDSSLASHLLHTFKDIAR